MCVHLSLSLPQSTNLAIFVSFSHPPPPLLSTNLAAFVSFSQSVSLQLTLSLSPPLSKFLPPLVKILNQHLPPISFFHHSLLYNISISCPAPISLTPLPSGNKNAIRDPGGLLSLSKIRNQSSFSFLHRNSGLSFALFIFNPKCLFFYQVFPKTRNSFFPSPRWLAWKSSQGHWEIWSKLIVLYYFLVSDCSIFSFMISLCKVYATTMAISIYVNENHNEHDQRPGYSDIRHK